MGLRPTQGDEKRLLSEATLPWKRCPHLCHLDRSEAEWRDLCVDAPSWKCFSTELPWACGPPEAMRNASVQQLLSIEPLPFPLSSRAQPRDLRFRGPFLEIFFDRAYPDFLLRCIGHDQVCGRH
jgi:hypothetical protein